MTNWTSVNQLTNYGTTTSTAPTMVQSVTTAVTINGTAVSYKIASLYTGPGSATVAAANASALTMSLAAVTVLATLF